MVEIEVRNDGFERAFSSKGVMYEMYTRALKFNLGFVVIIA